MEIVACVRAGFVEGCLHMRGQYRWEGGAIGTRKRTGKRTSREMWEVIVTMHVCQLVMSSMREKGRSNVF